jgi:DNA-directed RNA polymerase
LESSEPRYANYRPHRSATDLQFIDRYGEHRIPVSSAKAISSATIKRRERIDEKANKADALTQSDGLDMPSDAHALQPDSEQALESMAELTESASIELSPDDVEALAKQNNTEVEQELVGTHRFVRFKDVLPPSPPRGVFDVRRIKDSAYFFS